MGNTCFFFYGCRGTCKRQHCELHLFLLQQQFLLEHGSFPSARGKRRDVGSRKIGKWLTIDQNNIKSTLLTDWEQRLDMFHTVIITFSCMNCYHIPPTFDKYSAKTNHRLVFNVLLFVISDSEGTLSSHCQSEGSVKCFWFALIMQFA